jgi:hypothetical protein
MKKTFIILVLVAVCIASAFVLMRSVRNASANVPQPVPASIVLPAAYNTIRVGMTEKQVITTLGEPTNRTLNPRFETKTAQQWADIHSQLQAANASNSDLSAAPTMAVLKLGAELNHRIKDTLRYDPSKTDYVMFTFDGSHHLLRMWALPNSSSAPPKKS